MLEIPCTLRCDECRRRRSVILPATARYNSYESQGLGRTLATFTIERGRAASRLDVDARPKTSCDARDAAGSNDHNQRGNQRRVQAALHDPRLRGRTVTYRDTVTKEKVFNAGRCPCSASTPSRRQGHSDRFCRLQYGSHPLMPGRSWYVLSTFTGQVEDLNRSGVTS